MGDGDQRRVVGGVGDGEVEGRVIGDSGPACSDVGSLLLQNTVQSFDVRFRGALGGQGGDMGFEKQPHLEHVTSAVFGFREQRGESLDDGFNHVLGHEGSGPWFDDYHALLVQHPHCLADRSAAYAELLGKLSFWWEPVAGFEVPVSYQPINLADDLFGDSALSD